MKKVIITVALVAASAVGAFAQGKVAMQNNSSSLVTLTTDTARVLAADKNQAGTAVGNGVPLASGKTLVAGLYAGATSTSLSLYSPRVGDVRGYVMSNVGNGPGVIPLTQYQLTPPALPAGPTFLQVKVWDTAYPTYEAAVGNGYAGVSPVFQFTTGGSLSYPTITTSMTAPIVVGLVPEPTTAAIAGLGLASMLIFRRKK